MSQMKKLPNTINRNKRLIVIALVIVLIFVINPLLIINSFAGDAPLSSEESVPLTNQENTFWLWNFLGHLHPLAVHFPVGLLLFTAALELFTIKNFYSKLRSALNILLGTGVAASIISVILGLLLATSGDYGHDALTIHQYTGIATAVLGGVSLFLLYKIIGKNQPKFIKAYRAVLFITGAGVCIAGHFGAVLTHGADYLTATLPWSNDYKAAPANGFNFAAFKDDSGQLNNQQQTELSMHVKTIFAHNCYKCHGAEKVKGELRLDSKQMIFKGGEDGPVIIAGDLLNSDLYRRITLPKDHKEKMPSKGSKLSEQEIATIKLWIEKGAPWPDETGKENHYRVATMEPRNPSLPAANATLQNPVDLWVNDYFKKNNIPWVAPVDDKTYLRRIYLDIIGLLPAPQDLIEFTNDKNPGKRADMVRRLLNRTDDYAMHWLTFWNDALRNDYTGTGYITGGRFNINNWLYQSLKTNKPYDLFVQELISPRRESKGFIEGIKWRGVVNASQRTEMQAAQNVSQIFFGLNLKCASCHNSFISDWKLDDAYGFANIFADTSLEINRCDKPSGKFTEAKMLWKELGTINSAASAAIKQQQLAQMITQPQDGRLYRTIVNRIWAQLLGRGLVEPVDLMDNEPWSQDLLDWLAYNFVQNKSDIKELIFLITTSQTYQLPSVGFKDANQLFAKDFTFKGMVKRRMSGEQFADAVSIVVAPVFPDSVVKFIPFEIVPPSIEAGKVVTIKPVKELSKQQKAAADKLAAEKRGLQNKLELERREAGRLAAYQHVADKTILLYPRAALVVNNSLLTALGRPNRETVSTSRESQANLLQALELTNGQRFDATLKTGAANWKNKYIQSDLVIKEVYRKALLREPNTKEFAVAKKMLGPSPGVEGIADLFWAVMLLPEFQLIN